MKRLFPLGLPAMLILAIVLAGCGGGGGNNTPPITLAESLVSGASGLEVTYPYYMAQTEVTYQVWSAVKQWAANEGYVFANPGSCGGYWIKSTDQDGTYPSSQGSHPVTEVSWRDAIVWCNALTEYYNAQYGKGWDCAYTSEGAPIRDANRNTGAIDGLTDDGNGTKGFRLPTGAEWHLAARYVDGSAWTPDDYASGATAATEEATGAVAWYFGNSNDPDPDIYTTHPVGEKAANALEIYDLSGNVMEWCFDISGGGRLVRGGGWANDDGLVTIGAIFINCEPGIITYSKGFRPVRTE